MQELQKTNVAVRLREIVGGAGSEFIYNFGIFCMIYASTAFRNNKNSLDLSIFTIVNIFKITINIV